MLYLPAQAIELATMVIIRLLQCVAKLAGSYQGDNRHDGNTQTQPGNQNKKELHKRSPSNG
jgi:hypothetical protein